MAWYAIEPFGEERADLRSAMVACVIHNVNCTKSGQTKKLKDFMLNFKPPEPMGWQDMKKLLKGMCNG